MTSPRTLHDTGSPSEASSSAWGALHSDEATQSSGGKRSAVSGSEKRNRSAHEQENGRDVGQMGIAVLILLGVIASVVMLLLGSAVAMKVALLVLLWAAVLGMLSPAGSGFVRSYDRKGAPTPGGAEALDCGVA